jgi:hypothetical protein
VRDPFSNIPRARPNRVTQLLDAPVMALEVRRQEKQIDAQIEQVRELPRGQVTNIVGAVHAGACCNRFAVDFCAESGLMAPRRLQTTQNRRSNWHPITAGTATSIKARC